MTEAAIETAVISVVVIASRVISHFEHKRTSKQVADINIYFNGEMEKKLEQARQEGRDEILNSNK